EFDPTTLKQSPLIPVPAFAGTGSSGNPEPSSGSPLSRDERIQSHHTLHWSQFATGNLSLGGTFALPSQELRCRNAPVMQPRHAVQIVNCPLTQDLKPARSL